MPPALFYVLRAIVVALVGAVATVIVSKLDKVNDDDHQPFDDSDFY